MILETGVDPATWDDIISVHDESTEELLSDSEPESKSQGVKRRIRKFSEDPDAEESEAVSVSQPQQPLKKRKVSGEDYLSFCVVNFSDSLRYLSRFSIRIIWCTRLVISCLLYLYNILSF